MSMMILIQRGKNIFDYVPEGFDKSLSDVMRAGDKELATQFVKDWEEDVIRNQDKICQIVLYIKVF